MDLWIVLVLGVVVLALAVGLIITAVRVNGLARELAEKKRDNERLTAKLDRVRSQYEVEMNRLRERQVKPSAVTDARQKLANAMNGVTKKQSKPTTSNDLPSRRLQDDDILTQQAATNALLFSNDVDSSSKSETSTSHSFGGGGSFDSPSPSHHSSSSDSSSYSSGSDSSSYSSGSDSSSSGGSDSGGW